MVLSFRSAVRFVAVFTVLVSSHMAFAAMVVQQSIINYEPGDPGRRDVEIRNPDAEPLYIQVEVFEVLNPGEANEERRLVTNPKDSGFLVTPNRLAIQPGATKLIRLVNLKGLGDKQRVYRVSLKPVAADIEAEQTGVKILVGYQLLVLVSPMAPKPHLLAERKGKTLKLVNDGNTDVLLSRGEQCEVPATGDQEGKNCEELPVKRLYPGNKFELELKYDTPVQFLQTSGSSNQFVGY